MSINLILPYPPALNNMYFSMITKDKRILRIPTDRAKQFKADVSRSCEGMTPLVGEVEVLLKVFRPRRVGDLDGVFKAVFDSLKGFAYIDDKQITHIDAFRFEDARHPRIEIKITTLGLC